MASITLSNGTVLDNLTINGDNFIANYSITDDIFKGDFSPVTINWEDDCFDETHNNMKLVQITHPNPTEWWFVLQDLTDEELYRLSIEAKLDYLAMMSDVDLDEE